MMDARRMSAWDLDNGCVDDGFAWGLGATEDGRLGATRRSNLKYRDQRRKMTMGIAIQNRGSDVNSFVFI